MKDPIGIALRMSNVSKAIAFAILFIPTLASSQNNDWPKAIEAVEKYSQAYIDYGMQKSGNTSLQQAVGVAGLFVDVEKHKCAILGRMLGKIEAISELEKLEYPPLNDQLDAYEALEFGISLDNWVGEAKIALAMSHPERINVWNLDCVGTIVASNQGIASEAPAAKISSDGERLTLYGDIDSGFYDRLMLELERNPNVNSIALGSGGGSVKDALLAGREIRRRGYETLLYGNCYSACPLVFVGGVDRILWASVRHDFGFHKLSTRDGTTLPDDHAIYDLIAEYLEEMGVTSSTYIGWMQSASPQDMYSPEPHELCEPGVATFVQRVCNAEGNF